MYPEGKPIKWLFFKEKATLKTLGKGTLALVPLESGPPVCLAFQEPCKIAFPFTPATKACRRRPRNGKAWMGFAQL
jgi:hypothetical protein